LIESEQDFIDIDPEKYPRLTEDAVEDMLRFFYYNQETLDLLNVCCLFEFAKKLQLNKLLRCLERNIATLSITPESALFLLEVAFTQLDENPEIKHNLKERALAYVVEHMDVIDFAVLRTMTPIIGTMVLIGLQQIIQLYNSNNIIFDTRTVESRKSLERTVKIETNPSERTVIESARPIERTLIESTKSIERTPEPNKTPLSARDQNVNRTKSKRSREHKKERAKSVRL